VVGQSRGDNANTQVKNKEVKINEQYFTGTQVSVFIGGTWVDDINGINYEVIHDRAPVFGYGSEHFDLFPKGSKIVTGTFNINFREPNYLFLILEKTKLLSRRPTLDRVENLKEAEKLETFVNDPRTSFDRFFDNPDYKAAKDISVKQHSILTTEGKARVPERMNHSSFDIVIGYGAKLTADSPAEVIRGVQLMGRAKPIVVDGRAIQESYQFMARRLT
jgi:hypothetical protein